jgi:hypothetical protein
LVSFNQQGFGTVAHLSVDSCGGDTWPPPQGPNGYASGIFYQIMSRLGAVISNIGINESFGGTRVLQQNNWPAPSAKAGVSPDGKFFDKICVSDRTNTFNPQPLSPKNPLGSDAVDETRQTWFVGSTQSGLGVPVQNDSLKRFIDHGIHTSIVSPVSQ